MESIYLNGSESVARAGSSMSSAADQILRAANIISEAVDRAVRSQQEHTEVMIKLMDAMEFYSHG